MRPPLPRKSTYYIHPQIQREDPRVQRDLFVEGSSNRWVSPFSFMTPIRQLKQNDRIKNVLNELNLKVFFSSFFSSLTDHILFEKLLI